MKTISVGLIGAGRIGRIHGRNLKHQIPGARLAGLSDILPEAARSLATELDLGRVESDYHALLEDRGIDAVIVCTPTDSHAKIIGEAARAGKQIFCEKPIALDLGSIDAALAEVKKAGVALMVGFNRRFDPGFRKAMEAVKAGKIGRPHIVRITSRDPAPPPLEYVKKSGGLFLDMMIHDFDMARYLLGDEVTELIATGSCLVDPAIGEAGDIDTALVVLKYKGGAMGAIDNSRKAVYGYDQRIEVFGSEGSVMVGNKRPSELVLSRGDLIESEKPLYFFLERYEESYREELRHFVSSLQNGTPLSVSGLDGRISVLMGYAAADSLKRGSFVKVGT